MKFVQRIAFEPSESASTQSLKTVEAIPEGSTATRALRARFHPERRRRGLDGAELPDPGGYGGVPKDRQPASRHRDIRYRNGTGRDSINKTAQVVLPMGSHFIRCVPPIAY
jgi:hypothetical protein